ncbi:sulfotransferase family 2 domain-containing protein [Rhodanobacter sp. DHB23]|uniref:sulfotransferase family 2 domain-containing protein n=1 Tax=Rhodanobacter sp. DHB23 TaxID=2775923 RepID=UPI0017841610|nr:sulfotransferase family 2 domain-containing protein [Rhodanobacter sp. DHB23]
MKYFIHIPKSAGTSLRAAMVASGAGNVRLKPIYDRADHEQLLQRPPRLPCDALLFGHFSFGLHRVIADDSPEYTTVLRNPVERVISLYHHHHRFPSSPYHSLLNERRYTLSDFVLSGLTPETNNEVVRNLSASYGRIPLLCDRLANTWWRATRGVGTRQIDERFRLRRALGNVERFFVHVGCIPKLQETVCFLEEWTGLPPGTLKPPRENVFLGEREEVGPSTLQVLENANELDLELYEMTLSGRLPRKKPQRTSLP